MAQRPARSRRMSSRELIAKEKSNPSPQVRRPAPKPPREQQQIQQSQQKGGQGRERRPSFSAALAGLGASVGSSVKKWRRKSVMTRSMDKAHGSAAPPPPSSSGRGDSEEDNQSGRVTSAPPPVRPPTHRGFVGSSLTVLDDGIAAPQTMRVFLMNNSYFEFDVDPTTLAGEVCLEMRETLQLHNDAACSLFSYSHGSYFLMQDDDIVLNVVRSWNQDDAETGAARLVYKARIHIPDGHLVTEAENAESASNGAHRLCFVDAVHRTITGLYSIPLDDAPLLAALQLQSAIGDYDDAVHGPTYISDTGLENYVAPALMGRFNDDDELEDMVQEEHMQLVGTSRFEAERRYMQVIKSHVEYYGASFFAVRVMVQATDSEEDRSAPQPAIVAVSFEGIFLLSGWNLSKQEFHSFEVVTKWTVASSPDLFAFSVHDQMIYFLLCENPSAIEDCVQMHISTIINERRGAPSPNRRNEDRVRATKLEVFGATAKASRLTPASDNDNDAGASSHAPLPEGWEALVDPSTGKTYFWHEESNKTSWSHPSFKPPPPPTAPPTSPSIEAPKKAPASASKRRMTKRRKSALMHMASASRRRGSVNMVMAVSDAGNAAVEVENNTTATATISESEDSKAVEEAAAAAAVEEEQKQEEEEETEVVLQVVEDAPVESEAPNEPEAPAEVEDSQEDTSVSAWLENLRLAKYSSPLTELGVESLEDLKDVMEDDLEPLGMKKLEMRRFLAAVGEL